MAEHEKTALLSPVYDVNALAENIIKLITNNELRYRIASEGNRNVQRFSWEESYQKLKQLLLK